VSATARATVHSLDGGSADESIAERWTAWLRSEVADNAHGWRPGEWDPETLLFSGDLENPRTAAWKCGVTACDVITSSRSWCSGCTRAFQRLGATSKPEFAATHVPTVNRRFGRLARNCRIAEGTCGRGSRTHGYCSRHWSKWHHHHKNHPDEVLEVWAARQHPYGPADSCRILGCKIDMEGASHGLCRTHLLKWRTHCTGRQMAGTDEELTAWVVGKVPTMSANNFSLAPLSEAVRLEILLALQHRDSRDQTLDPNPVRQVVKILSRIPSIALAGHLLPEDALSNSMNVVSFMREVNRVVRVAFDRFQGIEPTDKLEWELVDVGIPSKSRTGRRQNPGKVSFLEISQPWLREVLQEWMRVTRPESHQIRDKFKGCTIASQALSLRPGGGADPQKLQFADMTALVEGFKRALRQDGDLMAAKTQAQLLSNFFEVLDFGRAAGLLDTMSGSFSRHSSHRIARVESNEDEIGKAIPESVIRQLDRHLELLGAGMSHGKLTQEHVEALARTVYIVLRDTGRRPYEVAQLRADCLEREGADWSLVWDNRKGKRNRRRLPITSQTVETIKEWQALRSTLPLPKGSESFLFPPATEIVRFRHLSSRQIWDILNRWATAIPRLDSEDADTHGQPIPFDRSLIFPYAFRHSYAQRHADAGIPIDVLKELMDHKSIATTQGYYKVSLTRKRKAVQTMRLHVLDRAGKPAPAASAVAYEKRTVQVPFGGCSEPSNVKAGGKACPIRFQCAGCGFYRPDPSYLPAVEDHVRSLKADRETALAMGVDEFVVRNLDDQVTAFQGVVKLMHEHMEGLPEDERADIEEASKILRKARAAGGRKLLPVTVIKRQPDEFSA